MARKYPELAKRGNDIDYCIITIIIIIIILLYYYYYHLIR